MSVYQSNTTQKSLSNPILKIGNVTVGEATKAEVTIDHESKKHKCFDGKLLNADPFPSGQISITKLTRFNTTTDSQFFKALGQLVPDSSTNTIAYTGSRIVTLIDKRSGGDIIVSMTGVYIDKFTMNEEAGEIPEFNVTLQSESINVYAGATPYKTTL